jgi:hypothetical protein
MNQVAKKEKSNIALSSMFEKDADIGLGNLSAEDFALPFLRVLGTQSPEVVKGDAKYVDGAEAGMIYNTVTKQVFDGEEGINVLPCFYKREYIEWSDRGQGQGAPIAIYSVDSNKIMEATRDAMNKDRLPNGNYLENTASYYVMTENMDAALVTMKSTGMKTAKNWNTLMNSIKMKGSEGMFTPPAYSHLYKLKSVLVSNHLGSWYGWGAVEKVGPVQSKDLYETAKSFAESCKKGNVKTQHGESTPQSEEKVPF